MPVKCIVMETITPRERMEALAEGKKVDRIPVCPILGEYPSVVVGVPVDRYLHSPGLMAEAQVRAFEVFGYDSVGVGPDYLGMAEAMGCRLRYAPDQRPQMATAVVEDERSLSRLKPVEAERDGRLPMYLEALKTIKDRVGDWVKVGSGVGGPFTLAACLRGTEEFLKDLIRKPAFAYQILEISTQSIMNYMQACFRLGVSCSLGEPLASCSVISPRHFRQFAKPYLLTICEWHRSCFGRSLSLHICGTTKPIWEDVAALGVSQFSFDEREDVEEAKRFMGARLVIKGNVPPVSVLARGSYEEVMAAATQCLSKGFDSPKGYVLSSGCTVPLETPPENIHALIEASRRFSMEQADLGPVVPCK